MTLHPEEMQNAGSSGAKLRILYVEEEWFIRKEHILQLENEGYKVFSAKNGRAALRSFRREKAKGVDVVITDFDMRCMGSMGGSELIKILREKEKFKGTIIISTMNIIPEDFIKKYNVAYVTPTRKSDFIDYLKDFRK